jgi:hypothetical protein
MANKDLTDYREEIDRRQLQAAFDMLGLCTVTSLLWDPWGFASFPAVGYALYRYLARDGGAHIRQLDRWCTRLGIDTPEILGHEYTSLGECYRLRVTGSDPDGGVMTPEKFAGYWHSFRAVAGDECRGVFPSRPDKRHGGRMTLDVHWRDRTEPYSEEVWMSPTSRRYASSPEEAEALRAEAERAGYVHRPATWAAPNPAEMQGEGVSPDGY